MVYPEESSILLEIFGASPKLRLLNIFLENPYFDFTRKELIKELGMSKLTVYKYLKEMESMGLIVVSRKIGKAILYKLNRENPFVALIENFLKQVSMRIAEMQLQKEKIVSRLHR